jgi:hypothetical protein
MTSNRKILNYKVVNLIESYNFHIKLPPSEFKQKNYKFLKRDWTPIAVAHGGRKALQYHASLPPSPTALDV